MRRQEHWQRRDERRDRREGFPALFARALIASATLAMPTPTLVTSRTAAHAQPLNLDQNSGTKLAGNSAAKSIADTLDSQAKAIEILGAPTPVDSVRIALRRAGSTLIRSGERQGTRGALHVFTGETIAARVGALDGTLAGDLALLDPTTLRGVARDLAAIAPDANPAAFESVEAMDRTLRDALAPLVQACGPTMASRGWISPTPVPIADHAPTENDNDRAKPTQRASMADLARALALSPEATKSFEGLDARLTLADRWISFRPWAEDVRAMVRSAAIVAGASRPPWLSDGAYGVLRVELVGAVTSLTSSQKEPERAAAAATLKKLAALGELARAADAVDATASGRSSRTTRAALSELIASPPWSSEPALDARLERLTGILLTIARGAEEIPERTVLRQLRPAITALEPAARQSSLQLLDILPRLVRRGDSMSDPAVLAAITGHARRVADLKLVPRVSDLLTGHANAATGKRAEEKSELSATDPLRPIADRVLLLAQNFARPEKRDAALSEFRELAEQLADYAEIPGERELRAEIQPGITPGDWSSITGAREKKIIAALSEARSRWLSERSAPRTQPTARSAVRLANFRSAIGFFRDAVTVRAALPAGKDDHPADPLQSWPGWEVSAEAHAALVTGLTDRTRALAEQLVSTDDKTATKLLRAIEADFAVVPLVARLDREATALALSNPGAAASPQGADALAQIALGPPQHGAWMARHRAELASLCCAAEELAQADSRGDAATAKAVRSRMNLTATGSLTELSNEQR